MSSYHQSLRGGERDRDGDRDRSRTDRDTRQPSQAEYERPVQRAGGDQGEPRSRDQDSSRSRLRSTAQMAHDDGRGSMYNNNSSPSMMPLPPPPSHGGGEGRFFQSPPIPMHSVAYQSGTAGSREGRFDQTGASRSVGGSNLNSAPLGSRGSYHQEQAASMNNKSHHYSPDNYAGGGRASGPTQQDRSMADKYSPRDTPSYLMPSPYTSGAPSTQIADRLGRREYPRDQPPASTYESRQMEARQIEARQMDSNGREGAGRQADRRERDRSPVRGGGYPGPAPVLNSMSSNRDRDRISQVEADMWQSRNHSFSRPVEAGAFPRSSERSERDSGERGRGGFEARHESRPMDPRQQQGLSNGGDGRPRHVPVQGPPLTRADVQAARAPRDPTRASAAALAVAAQWQGTSGDALPPPPPPARRNVASPDDRRRNAPLLIPFTSGGAASSRPSLASNGPIRSSLGGSSYQSRTAERALERDREPRVRDERQGREPRVRSPVRDGPRVAPERVRKPFDESHPLLTADVETATRGLESYLSVPVVEHIRALLRRLARMLDISTISCSVWAPLREIRGDVLQIAATERLAGVSWYTIKRPTAMIASVMRTAAENAIRYGTVDEHQAKMMYSRLESDRLGKEAAARNSTLGPERRRSSTATATPAPRPRSDDVRPSSRLSERELARMGGAGATRDRRSPVEDVLGTACYGLDASKDAAAKASAVKPEPATTEGDMEYDEDELDPLEDPLRDLETAEEGLEGELVDDEADGEVGTGQAGDRYGSQQQGSGGGAVEDGEGGSPVSQGHRSRSSSRTRSRSRSRSRSITRSKSAAADTTDAMDTATAAVDDAASLHDAPATEQEGSAASPAKEVASELPAALETDFVAMSVEARIKVEDDSIMSDSAAAPTSPAAAAAPSPTAAAAAFVPFNGGGSSTAPPPPKAARKAASKRAATAPANAVLSASDASLLQSSSGPAPVAAAAAAVETSSQAATGTDAEAPRRGRGPPIVFTAQAASLASADSLPLPSPTTTAAAAKGRKPGTAAAAKAAAAAAAALLSTPSADTSAIGADLTPAGAAAELSPGSEDAVPVSSTGSGGRRGGKRGKPGDGDDAGAAPEVSQRAVAPAQRGRKRR